MLRTAVSKLLTELGIPEAQFLHSTSLADALELEVCNSLLGLVKHGNKIISKELKQQENITNTKNVKCKFISNSRTKLKDPKLKLHRRLP